eukprot:3488323-Rhodomonas_salina.1
MLKAKDHQPDCDPGPFSSRPFRLVTACDGRRRFIPSRYLKWCVTTPLMLTTYAVLSELSLSE